MSNSPLTKDHVNLYYPKTGVTDDGRSHAIEKVDVRDLLSALKGLKEDVIKAEVLLRKAGFEEPANSYYDVKERLIDKWFPILKEEDNSHSEGEKRDTSKNNDFDEECSPAAIRSPISNQGREQTDNYCTGLRCPHCNTHLVNNNVAFKHAKMYKHWGNYNCSCSLPSQVKPVQEGSSDRVQEDCVASKRNELSTEHVKHAARKGKKKRGAI